MNPKTPFDALAGAFRTGFSVLALLALIFSAGCRTADLLPPADFSAPGWRVQQGQAVWTPPKDRAELAGELILATNANGNCFVQFSKNPFPVATAQRDGGRWQIEYGPDKYHWTGSGAAPNRFVWFQLPGALAGARPGGHWQFERLGNSSWRLANPRTGETLEGGFFP